MTPWCCRHKWTLGYIAAVTTLALVLDISQAVLRW